MNRWLNRAQRGFLEDLDVLRTVEDGGHYPRRVYLDVSAALYRILSDKNNVGHLAHDLGIQLKFSHRGFPSDDLLVMPREFLTLVGLDWDQAFAQVKLFQGPSMDPARTQNPAFPPMPTMTSSLKQWKNHTAAIFGGKRITVEENVRIVRHVLGGAHHGEPSTELRASIVDYQEVFEAIAAQDTDTIWGENWMMNGPIRQMVFVAGVTLAGVRPIEAKLLEARSGDL